VRFFLDNCLSPYQARALNSLSETDGHKVVHLMEEFPRNTPDEVWIPRLAAKGEWIIVSGDMRIFKSRLLRQVWMEARLTTFFLGKGWMNQVFWGTGLVARTLVAADHSAGGARGARQRLRGTREASREIHIAQIG
jgi:hypothetical protein